MMRKLDRRTVMLGMTGAALAVTASAQAQASGAIGLTLKGANTPVAQGFVGLSYEAATVAAGDFLVARNTGLLALIGTVGAAGTLRIGGGSSNRERFGQAQAVRSRDPALDAGSVSAFAAFVQATGWRVIFGLPLFDPVEETVALARSVQNALGGQLAAFQIGNEPDTLQRHADTPDFDFHRYMQTWNSLALAIRSALPGAQFAGPDAAFTPQWLTGFAQDAQVRPVLLTHHYYEDGPPESGDVTVQHLLGLKPNRERLLHEIANAARAAGLPFRITEANTVFSGGKRGVSDSDASALWALDFCCQVAKEGGTGVDFHGGPRTSYSPVIRAADGRMAAQPILGGLQAFGAFAGSRCVSADLSGAAPTDRVHLFEAANHDLLLLLGNDDLGAPRAMSVTFRNLAIRAARSRVLLTDGRPDGPELPCGVSGNQVITTQVPPGSAVLVRVSR